MRDARGSGTAIRGWPHMIARVVLGCTPTIVGAFDFGFMALAAPTLSVDLDAGEAYPWLFSATALAYGAVVMPAGALSQRIGARIVLAAGLALAATGLAIVAASDHIATALMGRALFGAGGGTAATPALAVLAAIERSRLRRLGFALMGGGVAFGFTSGVLVHAVLGSSFGWRATLGVVALCLAALACLAATRANAGARASHPVTGAALLGAATAAAGGWVVSLSGDLWLGAVSFTAAVALATVGWRRATDWLPARSAAPLTICLAGAATTASGVGATVLLGRTIASDGGGSDLVLSAFGLAALPAVGLSHLMSGRAGAAESAVLGLGLQGTALAVAAGAMAGSAAPAVLVAPIAIFGAGHVVASAGVASAIVGGTVVHAAPMGGLLVTAQYFGAGLGPVLTLRCADAYGDVVGMVTAAGVAGAAGLILAADLRARA